MQKPILNALAPAFPITLLTPDCDRQYDVLHAKGLTKLEYVTTHLFAAALQRTDASLFTDEGKMRIVIDSVGFMAIEILERLEAITRATNEVCRASEDDPEDLVDITDGPIHPIE